VTDLALREVTVRFGGVPVLDAVDLHAPAGVWSGLIGPNGAGKSTLLRAVAGLVDIDGGTIALDGEPQASMRRRDLARMVAFVPQRPMIPDGMEVAEYVLLGRTPHISYLGVEGDGDRSVVSDLVERLELVPFLDRTLGSLSGGELQRAILARALAQEATVLLLDEPTSALDVGHQQSVLELVDELRTERNLTVLSAMHDLSLVGQFAEHLVLLSGGRVVSAGVPREVLTEAAVAEHYGARVRVEHDGSGRVLVVPSRTTLARSR
jgi:iron complex transport system ATP-binding protein